MPDASSASLNPQTTSGSLLHRLAGRGSPTSHAVMAYLITVALTYVPLLIAAAIDGPLWHATDGKTVTFLQDWGLGFALLVSLPTLVVLLITDERVLDQSLAQVQADGVIVLPGDAATDLANDWARRFRRWNVLGQVVAAVLGIVLGVVTFRVYLAKPVTVSSWIAPGGDAHLAGYVYLYCITLLYALVLFYVLRCIAVASFLSALVGRASLHILPFHPDNCGGLRPVGRLGLRNQYTLSVLGLNIVLLLVVWKFTMDKPESLRPVMIGASIAYVILGPVVFMAPLLPFRAGMIHAKDDWTREVAQLIRREFGGLRDKIKGGKVEEEDEASIERLRKVGAVIDGLPVWPFDSRTLRRFVTAYVVPLGVPLLGKAVQAVLLLMKP